MTETECGIEFRWRDFLFFFGNRGAAVEKLRSLYPDLRFTRLKQVHGNLIREVDADFPDFSEEGDGLVSDQKGLALCSITADCVPVLMASEETGWFGAFHAGWRGVAARIIPAGVETLIAKGADPSRLKIWIGPHILQDSFEVEADVRDRILAGLPPEDLAPGVAVADWKPGGADARSASVFYYEDPPGKFRISLIQVLLEQIAASGVPLENVEMELDDTRSNPEYHSARRDREKSGRQVSWIAKLK